MAIYRILSFDGGGLRGLITARLLQRLNDEPGIAGWLDHVDLIAGTSTGGILALGLASGKSPQDIADLYKNKGPAIFDDSIWDDIRDLGSIIGAEYSNKTLKKELRKIFGDTTLNQLKHRVVIPSFDLDNQAEDTAQRSWKPKIFHNFSGKDCDGSQRATDVALYTSAAPTYFPSVDGYIDGGVFANNPSMIAIAQAISRSNRPSERAKLDDTILLSVGTGVSLHYIKGKTLDWGYAQWIKPLIEILRGGVAGIADFQARELLGSRYHRLQVVFGPGETIPPDAVSTLGRMDEIASQFDIGPAKAWITKHWLR